MPIFDISGDKLSAVEQKNFALERDLQTLIEKNLETVFDCRFVASEFSTGAQHAGRIDSLALSEEDNPVIIEHKKVESSVLRTYRSRRALLCGSITNTASERSFY